MCRTLLSFVSGHLRSGWTFKTATIVLAVLAVCTRAQIFNVNITIASNNRSTAIVPDETQSILIMAEGAISLVEIEEVEIEEVEIELEPDLDTNHTCDDRNNYCTVYLLETYSKPVVTLSITLLNSNGFNQTLILTVRGDLNASCVEYNVPLNFTNGDDPYVFTCVPQGEGVQTVIWRMFRQREELDRFFQAGGVGFSDNRINSSDSFKLNGSSNSILTISNAANLKLDDVAYYYVPSFELGDNQEMLTAETFIFVGPRITTVVPEFSLEVIFNSYEANNFSKIRCETETFPPSRISWQLTNEEYPNGVDVSLLNKSTFNFADSGSNFTSSINAILRLLNLDYDDDGSFTCTADNGQASASKTFLLRVKSPLRPLWPALGIVGVAISVSLFMLGQFSVEKIREKKKASNTESSEGQKRITPTSSGGEVNNMTKQHSAAKRMSSSKPLIDESTL